MNYLVTGATGFVGPWLVKRLVGAGESVRCLARSGEKAAGLESLGAEVVIGDVTRPETLAGVADGVDVVLHLATLGHMSNFVVSESMFTDVNVRGAIHMMDEALAAGVKRFVHCSSVAAMGVCPEIPADEKTPCRPHHPYGRSKLQAEKEVLAKVAEGGLDAVIVRFSMVYGPGDPRDILKLTRAAKRGFFPKVGRKPKLNPLIHALDAVEGLLLAAEKGRTGHIYLITNPRSEPFDALIGTIQKALGVPRIPLFVPEWAALGAASLIEKLFTLLGKSPPVTRKNIESTLADRVFSVKKAQQELGFHPRVDPVEGLTETVLWYKREGWV
ncbi:MAG: NAD-dependent epimerase/dehydratase family protein [Desulfobacterales bacterium]|nr:NAD-dependent epimerase/dehydratase family protein [Desulfobacterales bacterium]